MKINFVKILSGLSIFIAASSCEKLDNFEGPNASLEGSVFIEGTAKGNKIQTCTGNFSIRLEQLSWSETPAPQNIPIKIDGSYKNSKLFDGHYRISLFGGGFWPIVPEEIDISKGTSYDFEVMPYMFLNNISYVLSADTLILRCDLAVPINGVPKITEMQGFVNTTSIVGPGAAIAALSEGPAGRRDYVKVIDKEWSDFSDSEKSVEIKIPGILSGRTFFARIGVRFDDAQKNFNLSEIVRIDVP